MPPTPENNYQVGPTEVFSRAVWNAVLQSVAQRLAAREALEADFESLIEEGTQAALDLIQVNVGPQVASLAANVQALEEQLEDILNEGTAPNSVLLGGQGPAYYLALANATGILPYDKVAGIDAAIAAAVAALVASSPSTLDTLKELSDALGGDANFAANMIAALGVRLRFDTAQALSAGQSDQALANLLGGTAGIQIFKAGTAAAARTVLQIDRWNRSRNRIINGSMRFNQRSVGPSDLSGATAYPVDRFVAFSSAGGTLRVQQFATETPGGSPARLRCTVQAAKGSLAAGDTFGIFQAIEGGEISDAGFGAAGAKTLLVRFGCRSSIAGTFGLAFRNSAEGRSFVSSFTIGEGEVGTDVVRTISIPGDTTGTWLKDTGVGATLVISLTAGSAYQAAAGWGSGNFTGLTGQTNFMAAAGATFDLFDVGLYVDHEGNGIVPPYELPGYADELRDCMRYYYPLRTIHDYYASTGSQIDRRNWTFPVSMRVTPSVVSIANITVSNVIFGITAATTPNDFVQDVSCLSGAGGYVGASRLYGLSAEF